MTSRPRLRFRWERLLLDDHAAQLVEFAVSLPLLVVFVVGIFDFSGAFTLKQKLTNAARDAARVAAAEPITDLNVALPMSVNDAFYTIDTYLVASKINDCGITPGGSVTVTGPPIWTFVATSGCPSAGLTIIINRGYYFPATSTATIANANCTSQTVGGQTAAISTCVNIQYAYGWRFGRVASLLGSNASLPSVITATAVAINED